MVAAVAVGEEFDALDLNRTCSHVIVAHLHQRAQHSE